MKEIIIELMTYTSAFIILALLAGYLHAGHFAIL